MAANGREWAQFLQISSIPPATWMKKVEWRMKNLPSCPSSFFFRPCIPPWGNEKGRMKNEEGAVPHPASSETMSKNDLKTSNCDYAVQLQDYTIWIRNASFRLRDGRFFWKYLFERVASRTGNVFNHRWTQSANPIQNINKLTKNHLKQN